MKKILLIILGIIAAIIVIGLAVYFLKPSSLEKSGSGTESGSGQGTVAGEGSIVTIKDLKFNPATVNIKAGEKVTWKNEDAVLHDITLDDGSMDVDIAPGTSYTYIFEQTGIYEYHCDIHLSMTGTVNVK